MFAMPRLLFTSLAVAALAAVSACSSMGGMASMPMFSQATLPDPVKVPAGHQGARSPTNAVPRRPRPVPSNGCSSDPRPC